MTGFFSLSPHSSASFASSSFLSVFLSRFSHHSLSFLSHSLFIDGVFLLSHFLSIHTIPFNPLEKNSVFLLFDSLSPLPLSLFLFLSMDFSFSPLNIECAKKRVDKYLLYGRTGGKRRERKSQERKE